MSDYNSALPTRTESPGDIQVKVVDNTVTSQGLAIDASGRVTTKINDGAGNALASSTTTPVGTEQALITRNIPSGTQAVSGTVTAKLQDGAGTAITSQANGSQRALDVGINVAGVQVDPRAIRALTSTDVVSANLKDGLGNAITSSVAGATRPLDTALRDAAGVLIGSTTILGVNRLAVSLAAGGLVGTVAPTYTDIFGGVDTITGFSQQFQVDSSKNLKVTTSGAVQPISAVSLPLPTGASTSLNQTNGTQKSQSVDISGVLLGTVTNPLNVTFSAATTGTAVDNYNTAAAIAAAGTSTHIYTVTTGKTLIFKQIEASASGKMKIEIQIETGVATGVFTTVAVQFNSTASANLSIHFEDPKQVAAGVRVQIIRTNRDNTAQDLYSTIMGQEV